MRRLRPSDYRSMPWRNGGGMTTELLAGPEGSTLAGDRFRYRISIADVRAAGPFSTFGGYDRHIMLIEGAGMTLACSGHGTIVLDRPYEVRSFSGDWDVTAALAGGPVRDLNLIADREAVDSKLQARILSGTETIVVRPGSTSIVHVLEGELTSAGKGDTLVLDASVELTARGTARIALASVVPR